MEVSWGINLSSGYIFFFFLSSRRPTGDAPIGKGGVAGSTEMYHMCSKKDLTPKRDKGCLQPKPQGRQGQGWVGPLGEGAGDVNHHHHHNKSICKAQNLGHRLF